MLKLVPTSIGNLFISPQPNLLDLENISKFDIIWNMTDNIDFAILEKDFAQNVILGNIEDYNIPKDIKLFDYQLDMVVNCLKLDGKVLIHCLAGHGRTGLALASVMVRLEGLTAEEALNKSKKICHGPETLCQVLFVKDFFRNK